MLDLVAIHTAPEPTTPPPACLTPKTDRLVADSSVSRHHCTTSEPLRPSAQTRSSRFARRKPQLAHAQDPASKKGGPVTDPWRLEPRIPGFPDDRNSLTIRNDSHPHISGSCHQAQWPRRCGSVRSLGARLSRVVKPGINTLTESVIHFSKSTRHRLQGCPCPGTRKRSARRLRSLLPLIRSNCPRADDYAILASPTQVKKHSATPSSMLIASKRLNRCNSHPSSSRDSFARLAVRGHSPKPHASTRCDTPGPSRQRRNPAVFQYSSYLKSGSPGGNSIRIDGPNPPLSHSLALNLPPAMTQAFTPGHSRPCSTSF